MSANEKLVFEQTIEGMFLKGIKKQSSPKLKRRLLEAGLNLDAKLRPAYTLDEWVRFLRATAAELYPHLAVDAAFRKLGESMVDGYFDTFIGAAIAGMARVLGPKRTLIRTRQNFRSGNNYTEAKVDERAPANFVLWMNEPGDLRHLTRGILEAGLRYSGAKEVDVSIVDFTADSVTYAIKWSA